LQELTRVSGQSALPHRAPVVQCLAVGDQATATRGAVASRVLTNLPDSASHGGRGRSVRRGQLAVRRPARCSRPSFHSSAPRPPLLPVPVSQGHRLPRGSTCRRGERHVLHPTLGPGRAPAGASRCRVHTRMPPPNPKWPASGRAAQRTRRTGRRAPAGCAPATVPACPQPTVPHHPRRQPTAVRAVTHRLDYAGWSPLHVQPSPAGRGSLTGRPR